MYGWFDIFYNPTNTAQARTRWQNPAAITSSEIYWPRVDAGTSGKRYTTNNSPGINVSNPFTDGTVIVSKEIRVFVQYRCINTTTDRSAQGNFVVSNMYTINY